MSVPRSGVLALGALLMMVSPWLPVHGQASASNPKPPAKAENTAKPAEQQNVYFQSWDNGELKDCSTYSGQPNILICDDIKLDWEESFINLLGAGAGTGATEDQYYKAAFAYVLTHSKHFLVSFSQEAWPKPQTGIKLATWRCAKDKTITCKFVGREK